VGSSAAFARARWQWHKVSLAVLPFTSATSESTVAYLGEGIPEKLISTLSRLDNIGKVTARASSFTYRDPDIDPRRVGRELGVDMILTGRVTGSDNKLILRTDLASRDGRLVWTRERPILPDDVTALENDLTAEIVAGLHLLLTKTDREDLDRTSTSEREARLLVLKARYYIGKFNEASSLRARDLCRQALDLDPTYAPAHTALAEAYFSLANHVLSPDEGMPRVKAAALRAIELDPTDADAHVLLGIVLSRYEWEWWEGQETLRKALKLNPNTVLGQQYLGFNLIGVGQAEEARKHLEKASQLDPLSASIRVSATMPLYFSHHWGRRHEQAIRELNQVLADDSTFVSAYIGMGMNLLEVGQADNARQLFLKAKQIEDIPVLDAAIAIADARAGRRELALAEAETLQVKAGRRFVPAYIVGWIYSSLNMKEKALDWLEKSEAAREEDMAYVAVDPLYDPLRSDPRFHALLKRMKLDRL
jgi:TolB-like protein/cytochrome c-type biogenesis protein CcmH/NrfG